MPQTPSLKQILAQNTTINFIAYLYLFISTFFAIPLLIGHLGTTQFAVWTLVTTITNLSTVLDVGLSVAIVRHLSYYLEKKDEVRSRQLWRTYTLIMVSIALVLSLTLILFQAPLESLIQLPRNLAPPLAFLLFLNFLSSTFSSLPQAQNHFGIYNLRTFLGGTAATWGVVLLSRFTPSLSSLILLVSLSHFATLLILTLYTHRTLGAISLTPKFFRSASQELVSYGVKKFPGILSSQAVHYYPRLALASLVPLPTLPLFTIPQSIIANISGGISQLTTALFPLGSKLAASGDKNQTRKLVAELQAFLALDMGILVIVLWLFGEKLLTLWLKDPQLAVAMVPTLRLLSITALISSLAAIPSTILDALGKPEIPTLYATLSFLLQIPLVLVLTSRLGVAGVAIALLIHTAIQVPLFLRAFSHFLNEQPSLMLTDKLVDHSPV